MSAYVIVDVKVTDPERYDEYKKYTQGTLDLYGGRFVARGGAAENLEGDWNPERIVVLEFDTMEQAKKWWSSPEYAEPKKIRQSASVTRMIVVEGVA